MEAFEAADRIIALQQELTDMSKNATFRELLGQVVQNAQDETIDYAASADSIEFHARKIPHQEMRRSIIAYLHKFAYLMPTINADHTHLWSVFMFENHTRLQKLCALALICEMRNLASFGKPNAPVVPQLSDIPQPIVYLEHQLHLFQSTNLEQMRQKYAIQTSELAERPLYTLFVTENARAAAK